MIIWITKVLPLAHDPSIEYSVPAGGQGITHDDHPLYLSGDAIAPWDIDITTKGIITSK
jgi:hypothetical protein